MTTLSVQLSESLQALIDAWLDTIDRMLLGSAVRQDRLAIVKDVETQIHELLQDRRTEELDRDDVLAALARLDPPEAYLPEETGKQSVSFRGSHRIATPPRDEGQGIGRLSGILGLSALSLVLIIAPLFLALAESFESELLGFGCFAAVILSFVVSVMGLVLRIQSRRSGVWAAVGMVTSVIGLVTSFGAGFVLLRLVMQ